MDLNSIMIATPFTLTATQYCCRPACWPALTEAADVLPAMTAHRNRGTCSRLGLRLAIAVVIAVSALVGGPRPADALPAEVSTDDLRAIARSLGFLDSLPREGAIIVGVVYAPGDEAGAARTADRLNAVEGPNSTTFKARSIPVGALSQTQDHLDVLLVEDGACTDPAVAQAIVEAVRRRHVVSISSDPACVETKCCVLMVHSDRKVEIVLDTALADDAGAHFSPVFAMMVKRK